MRVRKDGEKPVLSKHCLNCTRWWCSSRGREPSEGERLLLEVKDWISNHCASKKWEFKFVWLAFYNFLNISETHIHELASMSPLTVCVGSLRGLQYVCNWKLLRTSHVDSTCSYLVSPGEANIHWQAIELLRANFSNLVKHFKAWRSFSSRQQHPIYYPSCYPEMRITVLFGTVPLAKMFCKC